MTKEPFSDEKRSRKSELTPEMQEEQDLWTGEWHIKEIKRLKAENDRLKPYKQFYDHIKNHLPTDYEVQCKICQQTFEQITKTKPDLTNEEVLRKAIEEEIDWHEGEVLSGYREETYPNRCRIKELKQALEGEKQ
jgi:hypothetical protein